MKFSIYGQFISSLVNSRSIDSVCAAPCVVVQSDSSLLNIQHLGSINIFTFENKDPLAVFVQQHELSLIRPWLDPRARCEFTVSIVYVCRVVTVSRQPHDIE